MIRRLFLTLRLHRDAALRHTWRSAWHTAGAL